MCATVSGKLKDRRFVLVLPARQDVKEMTKH